VELGDLWLPVSRFESALAARERLLALAAATTRALAPRWMRGPTALVVQRYMVRALFQWTVKG
jgi:hypothetical protein